MLTNDLVEVDGTGLEAHLAHQWAIENLCDTIVEIRFREESRPAARRVNQRKRKANARNPARPWAPEVNR